MASIGIFLLELGSFPQELGIFGENVVYFGNNWVFCYELRNSGLETDIFGLEFPLVGNSLILLETFVIF